jgi:hypothetical protein
MDLNHWNLVEEFTIRQTASLIAGWDPNIERIHEADIAAKVSLITSTLTEAIGRSAHRAAMFLRNNPKSSAARDCADVDRRFVPATSVAGYVSEAYNLLVVLESGQFEGKDPLLLDELNEYSDLCARVSECAVEVDSEEVLLDRWTICRWCDVTRIRSIYEFAHEDMWIGSEAASCNRVYSQAAEASTKPASNDTASSRSPVMWPWGGYETKLLRLLPLVYKAHWENYDPVQPHTAPKSEAVEEWLVSNHDTPRRVAEVIAQLFRADELPRGRQRSRK